MIQIQIIKKDNKFSKIEVKGHSNFAGFGQDIVCAGISTLTIAIFNGITDVCKIKNVKIKESDGFLSLIIPENLPELQEGQIDILLETLCLAYQQLSEIYPKEIKILR